MTVTRITSEARGLLRLYKQKLARNQAAIERLMPALSDATAEICFRGSLKGRSRVFDRLRPHMAKHAVLQDFRLDGPAPLILWMYLKSRGGTIIGPEAPGQAQSCVSIECVMAGALGGPGTAGVGDGLWTLEASDHALLRLLTRSPGADLSAVLSHAHHSLLALPDAALLESIKATILVGAGPGVFVCECLHGQDVSIDRGVSVHYRTKTWLSADQLFPGQHPEPAAKIGEHRLGDGWLRPLPLRNIWTVGADLRATVPPWVGEFGTVSTVSKLQ